MNCENLQAAIALRDSYRTKIQHEDHLINHRISWLVGSQSFLLGTYVLLINNPVQHLVGKSKTAVLPGAMLKYDNEAFQLALHTFKLVFPICGMVLSFIIFINVLAAINAIRDTIVTYRRAAPAILIGVYGNYSDELHTNESQEKIKRARILLPDIMSRPNHRFMGVGAVAIGPIFLLTWLWLLLGILGLPMQNWAAAFTCTVGLFVMLIAYTLSTTGEGQS